MNISNFDLMLRNLEAYQTRNEEVNQERRGVLHTFSPIAAAPKTQGAAKGHGTQRAAKAPGEPKCKPQQKGRAQGTKARPIKSAQKKFGPRLIVKRSDYGDEGNHFQNWATYQEARGTTIVEMNDSKYLPWNGQTFNSIGTMGLSGCVAVIISSPEGGFVAHYSAPEIDNGKAKDNLSAALHEVRST